MRVYKRAAKVAFLAFFCFLLLRRFSPAETEDLSFAHSADEIVSRMRGELRLTDEQISQIVPVIEAELAARKEIMEKVPELKKANVEIDALRKDTEEKLAVYLTAEQMDKYRDQARDFSDNERLDAPRPR